MCVDSRRLIYFDSLRDAPGREAMSSEPIIVPMDTELKDVVLPEVKLEDHVVQIRVGPEKCSNAGGFEGVWCIIVFLNESWWKFP